LQWTSTSTVGGAAGQGDFDPTLSDAAPVAGSPVAAPVGGSPVTAPVGGSPVTAPVGGSPVTAPVAGSPVTAPVADSPVAAPVGASLNSPTAGIMKEVTWNCFRKDDGRYVNTVTRVGGTTRSDGESACGGTDFKMMGSYDGKCDVRTQMDGCSVPDFVPGSDWGKEIFKDACDEHDRCYSGPVASTDPNYLPARKQCDDNFWNDMGGVCDDDIYPVECHTMRSLWGDAMNAYMGRKNFDTAFRDNQAWATENCPFMYGDGGSYPPCWGDNTICLAGSTCSSCCNMAYNVGGTQCGGSPWSDGTECALGTTCLFCANAATFWPGKVFTACGSEPCWGDNTFCLAGTTCNQCCNPAFNELGTQCGGSAWSDGTACALGTTCNLCANAATYWPGKVFTACGSEPCWGGGTVCGSGTTCNSCCSGADCPWWQFGVCKCN
jgi:hypothetical protein